MPWGKRTPNGRWQAARPEEKIAKTWTATVNETLRATRNPNVAFAVANMAVSEMLSKHRDAPKKGNRL